VPQAQLWPPTARAVTRAETHTRTVNKARSTGKISRSHWPFTVHMVREEFNEETVSHGRVRAVLHGWPVAVEAAVHGSSQALSNLVSFIERHLCSVGTDGLIL